MNHRSANPSRKRYASRLYALAACAAIAAAACSRETDQSADSSNAAPEYATISLEGDSVSLAGERGNVVLLNIWATWCHPCREETPMLQRLYERHAVDGFRVIGVSIDARGEQARIKRFASEFGVTYPIWIDPDESVAFQFRAVGVPASYLIDREGKVVWKKLGPIEEGDAALNAAIEQALKATAETAVSKDG